MEMEYQPRGRRGRLLMVIGVVLAIGAAAGVLFVLSQAQQQSTADNTPKVAVVVAAVPIPARKTIEASDVAVHEVDADTVAGSEGLSDPTQVIGRVAAVAIFANQPIGPNLLLTSTGTGVIDVLAPGETVGPNSPIWRAVALNVPDDRAVGGLLEAGQTVDIFLTVPITVPDSVAASGKYYPDKSTKLAYQSVTILAKSGSYYIVRVTQAIAEEIAHLEASGAAEFSFALRPDIDTRISDASKLGETTNLIIERYGIPIPETYPNDHSVINNPVPGTPRPLPQGGVGVAPAPNASP